MTSRKTKLHESLPTLWQVFCFFWPDIRPQRRLAFLSLASLFGGVVLRILEPWPLKFVIDHIASVEPAAASSTLTTTPVLVSALAVFVVASLRAWTDYLGKVGFFRVGNFAVVRVRERLYQHLQSLPLSFHRQSRGGDLIVRVTRDVNLLRDVTSTAFLPLIASLGVLGGMLTVMFLLHWQLALLSFAIAPLFWLSTTRVGGRIRQAARKQRQREGAMATLAAESLSGIAVVKAMGLEPQFAQQFAASSGGGQREDLKANRLSTRMGRDVDILLAAATAIVIGYGGRLALLGELTAGSLLVFLVYLKRAYKPAQQFAKYTARLAKAASAGERVIDVFEQQPEVLDDANAKMAPPLQGQVRFANVGFAYDNGSQVLDKCELHIDPGTCLALLGPSGAGKSTVLSLLLRLYEPQTGEVQIDGVDVRKYRIRSLRSQMSVVLQDNVLFAGSVYDNIICGLVDVSEAEVHAAARLARAHEFIVNLPGGYDATVGERGLNLSRGQRQRIAIARAALRRTPLLLLDEPTSGLDEQNETAVVESIRQLSRGRTTLLVTHNMELAAIADRVMVVSGGRIVPFQECQAQLPRRTTDLRLPSHPGLTRCMWEGPQVVQDDSSSSINAHPST